MLRDWTWPQINPGIRIVLDDGVSAGLAECDKPNIAADIPVSNSVRETKYNGLSSILSGVATQLLCTFYHLQAQHAID